MNDHDELVIVPWLEVLCAFPVFVFAVIGVVVMLPFLMVWEAFKK